MAVLPSDYSFSKRYTRACDLTIPPRDRSKRSVELRHKAEPQHLQRDNTPSSPADKDLAATTGICRHGGLEWRKAPTRHFEQSSMPVRQLPEQVVNRIAAG